MARNSGQSPQATRGRGFRRLFAVLALALAPLLSAAPEARAELLIGNLGIGTASGEWLFFANDLAHAFRTGSHADGYTLESVSLYFQADMTGGDLDDITVTVQAVATGDPGTILATLTNPATIPGQDQENVLTVATANAAVFTAPDRTVLAANTGYFVVVDRVGSTANIPLIFFTGGQEKEDDSAAGWSIAQDAKQSEVLTWIELNDSLVFRVNGAPRNNTPTPATGAPAITGAAEVGETLTAGKGTIADTNGLPSTTFPTGYTFQWISVDGSTETDISGATSHTYTLAAADLGKKVKVKVSFSDGGDNSESLTSAAYPSGQVNAACMDPTLTGRTTVWEGELTVGGLNGVYGYFTGAYGSLTPSNWNEIGMLGTNDILLIHDTPPVGMYVLNMFRMRGSRLWGSRLHRACVV